MYTNLFQDDAQSAKTIHPSYPLRGKQISSDVLTQLALADIGGASRALHKHGIYTDFLQK